MRKVFSRRTVNLASAVFPTLLRVLRRGEIRHGPHLQAFEQAFARYVGVRHAFGVSSARAGLALTLQALSLKPGEEVIVPAYTFHILPLLIRGYGQPRFVDVDPHTYNIDSTRIARAITPHTRAILVSHLFGHPCQMDPIMEIGQRHGLPVIEDCAHACGAWYGGKRVGGIGRVGLFSFGPGKNMPCFGGGMVTTNDPHLGGRLAELIDHCPPPAVRRLLTEVAKTTALLGLTRPPLFSLLVYPLLRLLQRWGSDLADRAMEEGQPSLSGVASPGRLANLQAAVGLCQLPGLDAGNDRAREHALLLNAILGQSLQGMPGVQLPQEQPPAQSIYHYYRLLVAEANPVRRRLLALGVDSKRDDMSCCPLLPPWSAGQTGAFPVASPLPRRMLEVPTGPSLSPAEIGRIGALIGRACQGG